MHRENLSSRQLLKEGETEILMSRVEGVNTSMKFTHMLQSKTNETTIFVI